MLNSENTVISAQEEFTLNRNKYGNPNVIFLGQPGCGLRSVVKQEISSLFFDNIEKRIYIIDIWGEYSNFVKEIGGTVINAVNIKASDLLLDRIICFDLSRINIAIHKDSMIDIIEFIWYRLIENDYGIQKYIYIDDASIILEDAQTAYLLKAFHQSSRPKNVSFTLISRTPPHILFSSVYAMPIILNTEIVVLLKQSPLDIDLLEREYELSRAECQMLNNANPGNALIIVPSGKRWYAGVTVNKE